MLEYAKLFKEDGNGKPCTVEFLKDGVVKAAFCIQESDKLIEISKGVMKSSGKLQWADEILEKFQMSQGVMKSSKKIQWATMVHV